MNPGDMLRPLHKTHMWKGPEFGSEMVQALDRWNALLLISRSPGAWDIRVEVSKYEDARTRMVEQLLVLDAGSLRVGWVYADHVGFL